MALLTPAGVKHARGLTRWADLDHVTISYDDWSGSVSLLFEADGLEEAFTPAMHRKDDLLRLVRAKVPAEKITEGGAEAARRPLSAPKRPMRAGNAWLTLEWALARFYCFLHEPEGVGFTLSLVCLALLMAALFAEKTAFVFPLVALSFFLHPWSRYGSHYEVVPRSDEKRLVERRDREEAQRQQLTYLHTVAGWWLWGQLLGTGLPWLGLSLWLDPAALAALGGLGLVGEFLLWTAVWAGAREVRLVLAGDESALTVTVSALGLPLWRRLVPYEGITAVRSVDRPPWYMLGMLWISRSSVWNLTPTQVTALETRDGQRYLVATDEPDALGAFLASRIGRRG